jgi:hypothetical protein
LASIANKQNSEQERRMIGSLMMCLSVVVLLVGMLAGIGMGMTQNFVLAPAHAHLNLIGGVLLFLFGLYYRLVPAAGTTTLAKVQGWLHMVGAIVFPAGVAAVLLKGPSVELAPIAGSLIVLAAMALFAFGGGGRFGRGFIGRAGIGAVGCNVTITGFGLWSSAAPVTASTPMPTNPPIKTLPAKPAAPAPGISLVRGTTCGSYPSLLKVTVMSALRFACTTQGVTQAIGLSRPDISAVAPAGVLEMEMFSVVPRVTDAQPQHGKTIAATNNSLIIGLSPAG